MPYKYILQCSDATDYVGSTWDLERRLAEHIGGAGAVYTHRRRPVRLVYCEEHGRIDEAYAREKQVQNWSRAKQEALTRGDGEGLRRLAKKPKR